MRQLSIYEQGTAALAAFQGDQRFSYALYTPQCFGAATPAFAAFDLIIAVHGSERRVTDYRDGFIAVAERLGCFVLAPLFPVGIVEPGNVDNYKYIAYRGLRYDLILRAMVAEVEARYEVAFRRRAIHGFSGGGQFVQRFALLQPEAVDLVSIGAPGKVTLIDDTRPWWVGTADVATRFGRPLDLEALRRLEVHLIVGAEDLDEVEIHVAPGSTLWMEGANDAGRNRPERLRTLQRNLDQHGIATAFETVPGIAHRGTGPVIERAAAFVASHWG